MHRACGLPLGCLSDSHFKSGHHKATTKRAAKCTLFTLSKENPGSKISSFTLSVGWTSSKGRPQAGDGVCPRAVYGKGRAPPQPSPGAATVKPPSARSRSQDQKERPLKLAERNTPANRKPAFWSSKVHGIPQNYKPRGTSAPHMSRPGRSDRALAHRTTAIKPKSKDDAALVVSSQASMKLIDTVTSELKRKVRARGRERRGGHGQCNRCRRLPLLGNLAHRPLRCAGLPEATALPRPRRPLPHRQSRLLPRLLARPRRYASANARRAGACGIFRTR